MNTLTKTFFAISFTSLMIASQSAMALDESQEKIPPVSEHMSTPHEHKANNSENEDQLLTDASNVADTKDGHHEVKELDDTNQ